MIKVVATVLLVSTLMAQVAIPVHAGNTLSKKEVIELQVSLNFSGYEVGSADGVPGRKTLAAVKKYLEDKRKKFDGTLSENEFHEIVPYAKRQYFRVFNDFSSKVYKSGIRIQPNGRYPKAVEIYDSVAKFTLTPDMYADYSQNFQRFEIGKDKINPNLAVKTSFRFRSNKNIVTDRTMIAQIKSAQKSAGGGSPVAAVYIDRSPQCATWIRKKLYAAERDYYVQNPQQHNVKGLLVYSEQRPNGMWEYNWADRRTHEINRPYSMLNDGKWHKIEMHVYPHRTKGFCRVYIDDKLMINLTDAPTKSYDHAPYGDYASRIGIYRDSVSYDQTVEFDDYEVIGYYP
jgi:peptidoglycan hydrolase-like protein with peptidoglycan-binding domain